MRGLLLVFTLGRGGPEHRGDSWFGPDKLQHFFTSAFVQSLGYGALRRAGADNGPAIAGRIGAHGGGRRRQGAARPAGRRASSACATWPGTPPERARRRCCSSERCAE